MKLILLETFFFVHGAQLSNIMQEADCVVNVVAEVAMLDYKWKG